MKKVLTLPLQVQDEDGNSLDPDSAIENCVTFSGITIQMEAFKNKWFDADDNIVIPISDLVSEEAVYKAGSTFLLAILWKRWQLIEESARFIGGNLRSISKQEWPIDTPVEINKIIQYVGVPELEILHRVAAERMNDKLSQNYFEMISDPNVKFAYDKASLQKHLLPPHGFVSYDEVHACSSISDIISYNIMEDQERPGGLRLIEWIRGYSALKKLVDENTSPNHLVKSRKDLIEFFCGYGLTSEAAEKIIDLLTFRSSSRDLFDHPLIKREDNTYQIFKTALSSMSIANVVMSAIGNLGEQLQKKGKSFETSVRNMLSNAGLKTYSFKASRNGEEFEYDVLLPWGDYLFVIECKNRTLPKGNPIQMHYFDLESISNIRQVKRLVQALTDYPDILTDHLPADAINKKLVPIVLNCLPYSIPQGLDGIYFYDYSALARFFKMDKLLPTAYKLEKLRRK